MAKAGWKSNRTSAGSYFSYAQSEPANGWGSSDVRVPKAAAKASPFEPPPAPSEAPKEEPKVEEPKVEASPAPSGKAK